MEFSRYVIRAIASDQSLCLLNVSLCQMYTHQHLRDVQIWWSVCWCRLCSSDGVVALRWRSTPCDQDRGSIVRLIAWSNTSGSGNLEDSSTSLIPPSTSWRKQIWPSSFVPLFADPSDDSLFPILIRLALALTVFFIPISTTPLGGDRSLAGITWRSAISCPITLH